MTWKPYTGEPFEGERIIKVEDCGEILSVENYMYYEVIKDTNLKNWDVYYLDESESFTKEDMREARIEAFEAGMKEGYNNSGEFLYNPKPIVDEWLKEREGK
jgi:hypothetical protein